MLRHPSTPRARSRLAQVMRGLISTYARSLRWNVHHRQTDAEADLGRGQPLPPGPVHRGEHPLHEQTEIRIHRRDRIGAPSQHGSAQDLDLQIQRCRSTAAPRD
jgi:hypothetical protein